MKTWIVERHGDLDGLALVDRPQPPPRHGEVLVRVRAVSLNYRDLTTLAQQRPGNLPAPYIPCSDCAGEVLAIGEGVTKWQPGDRVAGTFFQGWIAGAMTRETMKLSLGGPIEGVLAEVVALREDGLVRVPEHLSFEEAATLPCAGVTAWHALTSPKPMLAGESVLLLGTGGVSILALQFAKALGARVIITSSSDEKLARARSLGADETINYRTEPEWQRRVFELTQKRGVDRVVEVGGAGTLEKSLESLRYGGHIALMGVLSGFGGSVNPWPFIAKSASLQGIYVGPREMFESMNRAIAQNAIRPVIDRTFAFDEARAAFEHLQSGAHFGKVVIAGA